MIIYNLQLNLAGTLAVFFMFYFMSAVYFHINYFNMIDVYSKMHLIFSFVCSFIFIFIYNYLPYINDDYFKNLTFSYDLHLNISGVFCWCFTYYFVLVFIFFINSLHKTMFLKIQLIISGILTLICMYYYFFLVYFFTNHYSPTYMKVHNGRLWFAMIFFLFFFLLFNILVYFYVNRIMSKEKYIDYRLDIYTVISFWIFIFYISWDFDSYLKLFTGNDAIVLNIYYYIIYIFLIFFHYYMTTRIHTYTLFIHDVIAVLSFICYFYISKVDLWLEPFFLLT